MIQFETKWLRWEGGHLMNNNNKKNGLSNSEDIEARAGSAVTITTSLLPSNKFDHRSQKKKSVEC
jgi:hypothetical protein